MTVVRRKLLCVLISKGEFVLSTVLWNPISDHKNDYYEFQQATTTISLIQETDNMCADNNTDPLSFSDMLSKPVKYNDCEKANLADKGVGALFGYMQDLNLCYTASNDIRLQTVLDHTDAYCITYTTEGIWYIYI